MWGSGLADDRIDIAKACDPAFRIRKLRVLREPIAQIVGTGLRIADVDQMPGHVFPQTCIHWASTCRQKAVVSASEPQCGVSGCGAAKVPSERRARPPW